MLAVCRVDRQKLHTGTRQKTLKLLKSAVPGDARGIIVLQVYLQRDVPYALAEDPLLLLLNSLWHAGWKGVSCL